MYIVGVWPRTHPTINPLLLQEAILTQKGMHSVSLKKGGEREQQRFMPLFLVHLSRKEEGRKEEEAEAFVRPEAVFSFCNIAALPSQVDCFLLLP